MRWLRKHVLTIYAALAFCYLLLGGLAYLAYLDFVKSGGEVNF